MKYIITLLLFATSLSLSAQDENEKLIGTWTGESKGEVGSFIFDEEGFVTIIIGQDTFGGKSFEMEGMTGNMTYVVDFNGDPHSLEMTLNIDGVGPTGTLYGLFEYIDEDTMKMGAGAMNEKITAITEENSIILRRQ